MALEQRLARKIARHVRKNGLTPSRGPAYLPDSDARPSVTDPKTGITYTTAEAGGKNNVTHIYGARKNEVALEFTTVKQNGECTLFDARATLGGERKPFSAFTRQERAKIRRELSL